MNKEKKQFDAEQTKNQCVAWIQTFFKENGPDSNAVVGISGGKDSSVVAALCVEALGKERVIGVLMPCGEQADIDMALKLVDVLGIRSIEVNIKDAVDGVLNGMTGGLVKNRIGDSNADSSLLKFDISEQTKTNLPARIRMTALYAVSQSVNGRVANTCNLSEDWVGYSTRYGDAAGDFSPLSKLTVTEVKAIGKVLGLPNDLVDKVPIDGLSGKTDEENLGFTYERLDQYIREGICDDAKMKEKIDHLHAKNQFKLELMPCFEV